VAPARNGAASKGRAGRGQQRLNPIAKAQPEAVRRAVNPRPTQQFSMRLAAFHTPGQPSFTRAQFARLRDVLSQEAVEIARIAKETGSVGAAMSTTVVHRPVARARPFT
jgi:hypothetical protein